MSISLSTRKDLDIRAMPVVNLLPPEYAEREKLRKLQAVLGGVVATSLVLLAVLFLSSRGSVAEAQSELDAARSVGTTLAQQQALYSEVPASRAELEAAETLLATAMEKEVRWSGHLRFLTTSVPANMWFVEFNGAIGDAGTTGTGGGLGTVTFTGRAKDYAAVADWLDALEKHPGYANAWSSNLKLSEDGRFVNFTSNVTLTPDALYDGKTPTKDEE